MNTPSNHTPSILNRCPCVRIALALALLASLPAHGATYYWDLNGAIAGPGLDPNGTWDTTSANWNTTASGGTTNTAAVTTGLTDTVVFAAGNPNTPNSFAVTLNATQNAGILRANPGGSTWVSPVTVTLNSGTIIIGNGATSTATSNIIASTNATLTINSGLRITNDLGTTTINYLNFNPSDAPTSVINVNGAITATNAVSGSNNRVRIGITGAGKVNINTNLGSDANFAGAFAGFALTANGAQLTLTGNQSLSTTAVTNVTGGFWQNNNQTLILGDGLTTGTQNFGALTPGASGNVASSNTVNVTANTTASFTSAAISKNSTVNVAGIATLGATALGVNTGTISGVTNLGVFQGFLNVAQGGTANSTTLQIGGGSVATVIGTLNATGAVTLGGAGGDANNPNSGTLILGGGSVGGSANLASLTTTGSATTNKIVGGATVVSTLTITGASTTSYNGTLGGVGGNENNLAVVINGSGTNSMLTLSGVNNTYTGGTTIINGGASTAIAGTTPGNAAIRLGANNALGSGPLVVGDTTTGANGARLQLYGFNQTVSSLSSTGTTNVRVVENGATATNSTLTVNQNTNTTYTGALRDAGAANLGTLAFTKGGTGTLTLTGNNSYSGNTTISAGTLLINGNSSGATGAVNVDAGATLGGNGTIGGVTTILGNHSPGNSPGIQTFVSGLTYSGGNSTVAWELAGNDVAGRGTSFDGINVTGGTLNFAANTGLNLTFNAPGSGVLWGDSFWSTDKATTNGWLIYDGATTINATNLQVNVMNWLDSANNAFNSARPGASFSIYFDAPNNDVYLTYSAVPEPSVWALLAASLTTVIVLRRRRTF